MNRLMTAGVALFCTLPLLAQSASPAPRSIWTRGKVDISGVVDGYYSLNFNHPRSAFQALRNFDTQADRFALNMARLTLESNSGPFGFRADFGGGRAFNTLHATELNLGNSVMRHIPQAYATFKPSQWKGVQIDFGKFYTSAGAELTETHLNWNYSRSLLFALGPYYHFGARVTAPVTKTWTTGFQLINGWNNVKDLNDGKTMGFTNSFTFGKVSIANNYYAGPEKIGTTQGWRNFVDTVVSVRASEKVQFLLNYDYGAERLAGNAKGRFQGIAGAARVQLTNKIAISPRAEWYHDRDGITSGMAQKLKEYTVTGEYKLSSWAVTRLEFRRDSSNQPFFDRGHGLANARQQNTLLAGLVVYFGPKK